MQSYGMQVYLGDQSWLENTLVLSPPFHSTGCPTSGWFLQIAKHLRINDLACMRSQIEYKSLLGSAIAKTVNIGIVMPIYDLE